MTRIILVRHGETDWNAQRRYQGWCDQPLNETGLCQARKVAARLADAPIDAVYASDLARAARTAQLVAAPHGRPVRADLRLREMSFGDWEGRTFDEIQARWPGQVAAWIDDPLHVAPPGGETLAQAAGRVRAAYDEIVNGGHRTVALVSHGGPLRVLLCLALGLAVSAHWRFGVDVASLSELQVYDGEATLVKLNETTVGGRNWEN